MDNTEKKDLLSLTHTGDEYNRYMNAVVPPIFMNSLHAYDSVEQYNGVDIFADDSFVYGRDGNPTVHILERKIAELEHGSRAVVFASGMAAFTAAVMATCKAGSHVICMKDVLLLTRGIPWSEAVECVNTRRIGCVLTSSSTTEMRCVRSSSRRSGSASVESTMYRLKKRSPLPTRSTDPTA